MAEHEAKSEGRDFFMMRLTTELNINNKVYGFGVVGVDQTVNVVAL